MVWQYVTISGLQYYSGYSCPNTPLKQILKLIIMKLSEISFFQTQKWTFDMMDSLGSLVLTLNEIFAMLNTILHTKKWNDFYHAGLNNVFNLLILFFFYLNIFLAFSGFIDSIAEECDRKQGKRRGVTRSKGTRAGSQTRVHCRATWVVHATNRAKQRPMFHLFYCISFAKVLWTPPVPFLNDRCWDLLCLLCQLS